MKASSLPNVHPDPWVDLARGYITATARSLADSDLQVRRSWLDPRDPRDATIIFTDPTVAAVSPELALVWDEACGWRVGNFESGEQGTRTVLSSVRHLGGGVLPSAPQVAQRIQTGASEPCREYRSAADLNDGLDDALRDVT